MNLASSEVRSPNQCNLGQVPLRQGSPEEEPLEEVHVWLHPEEGLTNGDEAGNVQHPNRIEVLQL